jgi:soluble lytic murein transglycosylase-like protein
MDILSRGYTEEELKQMEEHLKRSSGYERKIDKETYKSIRNVSKGGVRQRPFYPTGSANPKNYIDKNAYNNEQTKLKLQQIPVDYSDEYIYEGQIGGREYSEAINEAGKYYNVNPQLLASMIRQESRWNPKAESKKGAKGIAQFIDSTATEYDVDVNDPTSSIYGMANMISDLKKQYKGDPQSILAGYNTGSGNWNKYISGKGKLADETKDYFNHIYNNYNTIKTISNGSK